MRLATYEYLMALRNFFIPSVTGNDKTYMACTFGMDAYKRFYTMKYVIMPDLLIVLKSAKEVGRCTDVLRQYTNPTLLILDKWLFLKISEDDAPNLLALIHNRRKHSSISSAPSSGGKAGTTKLKVRTPPYPMPLWSKSHIILIRSRLKESISTIISLYGKFMVLIQSLHSNC